MPDQLSLLDYAREQRARQAPPSLEDRFEAWLRKNGHVYDVFVRLAREARDAGATRIGAKMLAERVRWELRVTTRGDEYRVNNSYVSLLVRRIIEREPDLADLFELRRRRSE